MLAAAGVEFVTERDGGHNDTDDMSDTCVPCVSDTSMVLLKITNSGYETVLKRKEESLKL